MTRFLLTRMLGRIVKSGRLTVIDYDGAAVDLGDLSASPLIMRLHDRRVAWDIVRDPLLQFGEAYVDGRLTVENGGIADVLELLARNMGVGFGGGHVDWIARLRTMIRRWQQRNSLIRARRNVAHHYDLSGRLYDLFLDADKQYSCAFFETPSDSLEAAQLNKKRRIAAKLALKPGQKVLDVGSGWGGLGVFLATTESVDVTGVTLSTEQLNISNARVSSIGLDDRVRFRLEDYRHTAGKFDRVVSIGMFEHVGVAHYDAYFKRVAELLEDDGVALIHSIGRADGPGTTNPWVNKYIFPGAYAPALSEVLPSVERAGLIATDVEVWRMHYAYTLAEWRQRFIANWDRAKAIYDERFCRMWEFYLAGVEMGFRYQGTIVFQIQLAKRIDALPIVRDYMTPISKPEPVRAWAQPRA